MSTEYVVKIPIRIHSKDARVCGYCTGLKHLHHLFSPVYCSLFLRNLRDVGERHGWLAGEHYRCKQCLDTAMRERK